MFCIKNKIKVFNSCPQISSLVHIDEPSGGTALFPLKRRERPARVVCDFGLVSSSGMFAQGHPPCLTHPTQPTTTAPSLQLLPSHFTTPFLLQRQCSGTPILITPHEGLPPSSLPHQSGHPHAHPSPRRPHPSLKNTPPNAPVRLKTTFSTVISRMRSSSCGFCPAL